MTHRGREVGSSRYVKKVDHSSRRINYLRTPRIIFVINSKLKFVVRFLLLAPSPPLPSHSTKGENRKKIETYTGISRVLNSFRSIEKIFPKTTYRQHWPTTWKFSSNSSAFHRIIRPFTKAKTFLEFHQKNIFTSKTQHRIRIPFRRHKSPHHPILGTTPAATL